MITFDYRETLNIPIDVVWAELSDFGALLNWLPRGDESTLTTEGEGIGMVRNMVLPNLGEAQHRLDALDHDNQVITYSMTKGFPAGMLGYTVTVSLSDAGEGQCTILWEGQAEGDTPAEEEAIAERFRSASYPNLTAALAGFLTSGADA